MYTLMAQNTSACDVKFFGVVVIWLVLVSLWRRRTIHLLLFIVCACVSFRTCLSLHEVGSCALALDHAIRSDELDLVKRPLCCIRSLPDDKSRTASR